MDKSEKKQRQRLPAPADRIIAKYRHDEDDDIAEQWRKYRQARNLPVCHDRSERRHSNSPIDTTMGYHYPADISRLRKHHASSSRASGAKYQISSVPEEVYRASDENHGILKTLKNYPNNFAIVSKSRYKDDEDDPADDNPEEETGEENADEENENVSDYSDKDYEEQEADDEVDEESDVLEPHEEILKRQKKNRTDAQLRIQKISKIEPSHGHRHQKIGTEKNSQRCCHVADERDNIDVPSEDDEDHYDLHDETKCPSKKTTCKYHDHQDKERRIVSKNFTERYSNLNKMGLGSEHQNRRPRTTKPDVESSMPLTRVHHGPIRNNRCSNCGSLTGQKPKTISSSYTSCGLQGNRYFTRMPIGDEGVYLEDLEPTIAYQRKPRRSKEPKSQGYDPREDPKILDAELGAIYKSCRTKIPQDLSNSHEERTRHSMRVNNRHEPLLPSKNDNRY